MFSEGTKLRVFEGFQCFRYFNVIVIKESTYVHNVNCLTFGVAAI